MSSRRRDLDGRNDRRHDLDLAVHERMDGAHEVERGAGFSRHFLRKEATLLFAAEPRVALLAGGSAQGAPALRARFGWVYRDLFAFRVDPARFRGPTRH